MQTRYRDGTMQRLAAAGALLVLLVGVAAGALPALDKSRMTATGCDPQHATWFPSNAINGSATAPGWYSADSSTTGAWLRIDLGRHHYLDRVDYLPRQDNQNGRYNRYVLFVATNRGPASARVTPAEARAYWGDPIAEGNWPDSTALQTLTFDWETGAGRYVVLYAPDHGYGTTANAVKELTLYGATIALADQQTGSRDYTNSNTVDVADFFIPPGYDQYQINQITNATQLEGEAWIPTHTEPATVEFVIPDPEGLVRMQAWFKDSTATLPVTNLPASITYVKTTADVSAVARATLSRPSWGAEWPAIIYLGDIENGSTSSIGIHSLAISAADDQTPDDSQRVTLVDPGVYTVTLTVTDSAGNPDTDTTEVTVTAGPSPQTTVWTGGAGTTDWFEHGNWNNYSPGPGAVASIGSGNVVLSAPTAPMASFILSGGTLTFTGWETRLTATEVAINGGTLTHPLQSALEPDGGVWIPDNRIWIVCTNFVLNTTVNLAARGFREGASAPNSRGRGPGGGEYGGGGVTCCHFGGGGYGGYGGDGFDGAVGGGEVYGSVAEPHLWPGSGGANRGHLGGHGGGLFVLEADGHVVLNGTINVNGGHTANYWGGGGGSGGGVAIRAVTLAATNAWITANGGNGGGFRGGSGGGGRIAITLADPGTQDMLPVPELGLQARFGLEAVSGASGTAFGDYGTVWIDHDHLMPAVMNGRYGYFHGPIVANVTRTVFAVTNGWIHLAGNTNFVVATDLNLSNAGLHGLRHTDVGGNLIMTNRSTMSFYGYPTNGFPGYLTTRVTVSGDFVIGANSTVWIHSDPVTGGSVFFEVNRLELDATATINADQRGYAGGNPDGCGPGRGTDGYGGGGYGGTGGRHPDYGGATYGSAIHPDEPGSGGAGRLTAVGRSGGGLIHITATDTMALHGTLTANGGAAANNIGAGSGGGIYLLTDRFDPAEGTIRAEGGAGLGSGGTAYGGGGGGRIARLYRSDGFAGPVSVAGGAGNAPGQPGSIHAGYSANFMTLRIQGAPARRGTPTPDNYGDNGILPGTVVTNSVNTPADEDGGVRYHCIGWHFVDENGFEDTGSGTNVVVMITTNATLTWIWTNQYYLATTAAIGGSLQTDRSGWYTDGDSVSLTPAADGGRYFAQWSGDYLPQSFGTVPLPILMDRPRVIRANFGLLGGQTKTWIGGTNLWMHSPGWSPEGIPARDDSVIIDAGEVTLNEATAGIAVLDVLASGRLVVNDADFRVGQAMRIDGTSARVTMTRADLSVGANLSLLAGGSLYVNSAMTNDPRPGDGAQVSVTGDLSVGAGSWVYPQSHNTNGGSVFFKVANLYVAGGGGFNASGRGFRGGLSPEQGGPTVGWGPGRGNFGMGAGYGGAGGGAGGLYGQTYGVRERPIDPGSGGGGADGNPWRAGGHGGGLIRIAADRYIRLDGSLLANGNPGSYDYGTGGGSGGGIHLWCRRFDGTGGVLSANGGNGYGGTSGTSGGGGRIAVWRTHHRFSGSVTVDVGTPLGNPPAEVGTIYWGDIALDGSLLVVR